MPINSGIMVSLNDWVEVRLTPRGFETYAEYWRRIGGERHVVEATQTLKKDAEGWCAFQLFDLFRIFGHATVTYGGGELFEKNAIRFR